MILTKKARDFKSQAYIYVPSADMSGDQRYKVEVEYHGQFYNKGNGKIKKKDGQNLDKCLYDVIFDKLGVDDSVVFEGSWKKVHNVKEEFTLVTITKL